VLDWNWSSQPRWVSWLNHKPGKTQHCISCCCPNHYFHYFPPGPQLPSQPQSISTKLYHLVRGTRVWTTCPESLHKSGTNLLKLKIGEAQWHVHCIYAPHCEYVNRQKQSTRTQRPLCTSWTLSPAPFCNQTITDQHIINDIMMWRAHSTLSLCNSCNNIMNEELTATSNTRVYRHYTYK